MKKVTVLTILVITCITGWGQIAKISELKDSINFQAPTSIASNLHPIDSVAFHKLFSGSKLLGQWENKCCFYLTTIEQKAEENNIDLFIIAREGHYRPYLILAILDKTVGLIDEVVLAEHFVDAGEAVIISSTLKKGAIEQKTLDYN